MKQGSRVRDTWLKTDAAGITVDKGDIAHFQVAAASATAASTTGIHAAVACTTPAIAATCAVKASTAVTDILTTTAAPASLGATANALSILLTTAGDDNLAVSKDDETGVITIALAKTTAAKNTAALIQAAIRALSTVADVSVAAFTCAAGGNWDTAAIATGETAAVSFTGGQTAAAQTVSTGFTQPSVPRNVSATADGTAADIKAVQVVVTGTDYAGATITETLPAFTENTAGTVLGSKAFASITSVSLPAHDGTGATTAIGFGEKLGLPHKLAHDTVIAAYLNNVLEGTAPTVAVDADNISGNTIDLASSLAGTIVDAYYIV